MLCAGIIRAPPLSLTAGAPMSLRTAPRKPTAPLRTAFANLSAYTRMYSFRFSFTFLRAGIIRAPSHHNRRPSFARPLRRATKTRIWPLLSFAILPPSRIRQPPTPTHRPFHRPANRRQKTNLFFQGRARRSNSKVAPPHKWPTAAASILSVYQSYLISRRPSFGIYKV